MESSAPKKTRRMRLFETLIAGLFCTVSFSCGSNAINDSDADTASFPVWVEPLQIVSTTPSQNSFDVPISTTVSVVFSQDIDPSSITSSSFSVKDGDTPTAGTIGYDEPSKTAEFKPSGNLEYATRYSASISQKINDIRGLSLRENIAWSFKTVSQPAKKIAAGNHHACAILNTDLAKCWGYNKDGALGLGDTQYRGENASEMGNDLPIIDLGTDTTTDKIASGENFNCAIVNNAMVKCWGANGYGRLGQGNTKAYGDNSNEMGDDLPSVDLGTGRSATDISTGDGHACAILDNGNVKCWGHNGPGELGQNDTASRGDAPGEMGESLNAVNLGTSRTAIAITTGKMFTCALLDNEKAKCWGNNQYGTLGNGDDTAQGDDAGEMENLQEIDVGSGRSVKKITSKGTHVCVLLDNDTVKCWGANNYGQLGIGDSSHRGNESDEMGDYLPAVDLGTGGTVIAVSAGADHTCALLDNGAVKCWGYNEYGQLGLGDTKDRGDNAQLMGNNLPSVDLGTDRTAEELALGEDHTCALLDNGAIKCWGRNDYGQLGLG
ncbi:MAG: hypothetical protein GY866_18635, partial [Proteobacteria bacterium]|nr:hypothetical protein [Pseudomonadota bacterium]